MRLPWSLGPLKSCDGFSPLSRTLDPGCREAGRNRDTVASQPRPKVAAGMSLFVLFP